MDQLDISNPLELIEYANQQVLNEQVPAGLKDVYETTARNIEAADDESFKYKSVVGYFHFLAQFAIVSGTNKRSPEKTWEFLDDIVCVYRAVGPA